MPRRLTEMTDFHPSRRRLGGVLLSLAALCVGCSQFRGLPTHGGGKRFEEEQRAVAAAIRRTVGCMDLAALRDKRVLVVVSSLATSGSGTTDFAGPQFGTVRAETNVNDYDIRRSTTGGRTVETHHAEPELGANLTYRLSGAYRAANQPTDADLLYFRACLDMKARHAGLGLVNETPQAVLHVLVDVLGTNQSRRDYVAFMDDELLASCEVTYYAQEVGTGRLLFHARQTGATAGYHERRLLLTPVTRVSRTIEHAKPVYFDTNGHFGTTQPDGVDVTLLAASQPDDGGDQPPREAVLESLFERARFHLESGNAAAAQDYVRRIRELDPGYRDLGDLEKDLARMAP